MASRDGAVQDRGILEDESHEAVSSYFIGPHAENLRYFKDNIETILNELGKARRKYYPNDGVRYFSLICHLPH